MLFDPRFIFVVIWSCQVIGQLMSGSTFGTYSLLTWAAIGCAVVAFLSGSIFGAYLPFMNGRAPVRQAQPDRTIRVGLYVFIVVYSIVSMLVLGKLYLILRAAGGGVSMSSIRQAIIADFLGPRQIFGLLRVFFFGVGVCIFFLAHAGSLKRRELLLVVLIGLASALLTTGRLYLLMFFVASSALFYRQGILTLRGVVGACIAFVVLFFLVAIVLGKGASGQGQLLSQITWNAQIYLLSSVACFDNYVQTGLQEIPGGALLPNAVRGLLSGFGVNVPMRPALMPFVSVPMTCNTYTALFPLYHDGSLPGVLVGFFGIGLFHQLLFKFSTSSQKPIAWYLYAVSIYPLCMSIFEDSYFSSPGFWVLLWIPPLLHVAVRAMVTWASKRQAEVQPRY